MAAYIPRYAKRETILMRYIKRFHEQLIHRLGRDSADTMRACAWQIDQYLETHGKYADSEFMRALQQSLEKIVQQRQPGRKDWTVAKMKRDMRGRVTGVNQFSAKKQSPRQRPFVPRRLSQGITDKILEASRQTDETPS